MNNCIKIIFLIIISGSINPLFSQWSGVKKYDGPASMSGINLGIKLNKSDAKLLQKEFMQMSSEQLEEIFFQGEFEPYLYDDFDNEDVTYTPIESVDMAYGTLYIFQINNIEEEGFNGNTKIGKYVFNDKRYGYEVYAYEGNTPGASGIGKLKSSIYVENDKIIVKTTHELTYPGLFTVLPPAIAGKIPLKHTVINEKEKTFKIESWVLTEESVKENQLDRYPPNDLEDYLKENGSIDTAIEVAANPEFSPNKEMLYGMVKALYLHQKEINPDQGSKFVAVTKNEKNLLYKSPKNEVVEEIPSGNILYVLDPDYFMGWYKVNYQGRELYIESSSVVYNPGESEDKGEATSKALQHPMAFSIHPNGSVYILDDDSRQVFIYNESGEFQGNFAKGEIGSFPLDIEVSPEGKTYILTDDGCFIFDQNNKKTGKFGDFSSKPKLKSPRSLEISGNSIFILTLRERVSEAVPGFYVYDLQGNFQRIVGETFEGMVGIDLDAFDDFDASYMAPLVRGVSDGNIYALGNNSEKLVEVGSRGLATGIAVDSKNDFTIYAALSRSGNEIVKYDKNGELVGSLGSDILSNSLKELKIHNDHLYVADYENRAVFKFTKEGKLVSTYGSGK